MNPFTLYQDDKSSPPQYSATVKSVEASIAPPPCKCVDCQNGFYTVKGQYNPGLSYHRRLSNNEAKRSVLSAMGDIHYHQWKKRSQAKREALLKEAAPELKEDQ
ncbi:hypothetical protein H9Q70_012752 [Fusarium xylarioides]|nr:hypothetical protein H9Q70_012752 [Fusarium xylarioides]KAG5770112.1 hypothetical protein H9Q73_013318 [Fusarium xylarioides]